MKLVKIGKAAMFMCLMGLGGAIQAQSQSYTIRSEIEGIEGDTYHLTIWNGTSETISKEANLENGQIHFADTTSVPLVIRLGIANKELYKYAGRGYFPVKSQYMWIVAEPGSDIHLKGHLSDFAEVYPEGGKENEIIKALNQGYHPLINQAVNISVQLADENNGLTEDEINSLRERQSEINKKANEYMIDFLQKNVSSIAGLYYTNDMLLRDVVSIEMAEKMLLDIAPEYQKTNFYTTLQKRIDGSKFDVGREMFKINSMNTLNGELFSIDNWSGKFYLIDFWGSWCMPCIADVPDLKKLRDEFPEQLEILGIASDKEPGWRKAVDTHQLDWAHILNGKQEQDYVARLNVTGFPTKILVDPNGIIVYRSSGGGEESFRKMAEIIKGWEGRRE